MTNAQKNIVVSTNSKYYLTILYTLKIESVTRKLDLRSFFTSEKMRKLTFHINISVKNVFFYMQRENKRICSCFSSSFRKSYLLTVCSKYIGTYVFLLL